MTQADLLQAALTQSAIDLNCAPEDLISGKKIVVESAPHPKARAYLRLPFACNLVSYGGGVVASVSPETRHIVTSYIEKYPTEHLSETPNLHALDDALAPHGLRTCFMAEYFLPDLSALRPLPCKYDLRLLQPDDFRELYLPQWSNALSDKRPHLDVLGVGAYDGEKLIGLGVVVSNNYDEVGYAPTLEDVDGVRVLDVPIVYAYDYDETTGTLYFAVRVINIPDEHKDTTLVFTPYFIFENNLGEQEAFSSSAWGDTYNRVAGTAS